MKLAIIVSILTLMVSEGAFAVPIISSPDVVFFWATAQATKSEDCIKKHDRANSSCSSGLHALSSNVFRVVAQASADGGVGGFPFFGIENGFADYTFRHEVPYIYDRHVVIDRSGPVTMATFPVVNRVFQVEAARYIRVSRNPSGFTVESATSEPLSADGTGLATIDVLPRRNIFGPDIDEFLDSLERVQNTVLMERSQISAPAVGEDFSLAHLVDMFGREAYWDRSLFFESSFPFIGIEGSLLARSTGSGSFPVHFDGGEAIACMGLDSTMSSFDLDCWNPSGIEVTALFSVDSFVTVPVEFLGQGDPAFF